MKLDVISGQPNVDLKANFEKILKQNGYNIEDSDKNGFMIFPELTVHQPRVLFNYTREKVCNDIENGNDLFILTYSDHVLNAVRVEIKKHNFVGGKLHQFTCDGEDVCADILSSGKVSRWADDIFDTWERALIELL